MLQVLRHDQFFENQERNLNIQEARAFRILLLSVVVLLVSFS